MNRIIFLIAISLIVFSCKTSHKNISYNYTELGIAQVKTIQNATDSITEENSNPIVFSATKDSVETIVFTNKKPISQLKHNTKLLDKYSSENPLLKAHIKNKKFKNNTLITSKSWNIIVSVIVFLAGVIAFLTIPYVGLAIIFMVLGIILFILATQKFPAPEEPQYHNPEADKPTKPLNIYAKIALVFFLLSILLFLTIFFDLALFVIAPFTFLAALLFAISALIDIKKKNNSENGKSLAWIMLILSALPVLLVLILLISVLIYGIGE